jgi:hypothetical protein
MSALHKKARKNMAGLGVFFTALVLFALVGLFWSFFDQHGFFIPEIQRKHCVRNLETIARTKAEFVRDHSLTNGAVVTAEQLVEYLEDGWQRLRCPGRGTYTIHPAGEPPTCSVPTHH